MGDFCDVCGKYVSDVAKHKRRKRCGIKGPESYIYRFKRLARR
jgi:hypothetical protein